MSAHRPKRTLPDGHRHARPVAAWSIAALVFGATACGTPGGEPAPTPIAPSGEADPVPATSFLQQVSTVFGTAFEHDGVGIHPRAGLPLRVRGKRGGASVTVEIVTDAAGRYAVDHMQREYVSVSVQPQGTYLGPCSAFLWSWSDEPIDVHVVSLATFLDRGLPMTIPPFVMPRGYESVTELWGFVTERTPNGPRPVPLAMVEHVYGDGLSGDATGYALTNAQGFYHLCGYWDDFGQSVRVSKPGYRTAVRPWLSEPGLDIELASE